MLSLRIKRNIASVLAILALFGFASHLAKAQAALLMEEPYGFFGALNPTGHTALYFQRICVDTPTHLRPCGPGELGSVIARYQGIAGYDWIATPLVPYLYSVEQTRDVPEHVNKQTVYQLRSQYRERHLMSLGENIPRGGLLHGGWSELIGVAYERRIYAFRFNTTAQQDYALMERLNTHPNESHFQLLFNNCADFARLQLNEYFPGTFHRSFFPDAGVTTPKQVAHSLVKYGRHHEDIDLTVFEIPQIPGYRRQSGHNKDIAESLITTAYAVPIAIANPYIAGGLIVDYLIRGRYHFIPRHPQILDAQNLPLLTRQAVPNENPMHPSPEATSLSRSVSPASITSPAPIESPTELNTGTLDNEY